MRTQRFIDRVKSDLFVTSFFTLKESRGTQLIPSIVLDPTIRDQLVLLYANSTTHTTKPYGLDEVSEEAYNSPFGWLLIALLNGIERLEDLEKEQEVDVPPYEVVSSLLNTQAITQALVTQNNEPDLTSLKVHIPITTQELRLKWNRPVYGLVYTYSEDSVNVLSNPWVADKNFHKTWWDDEDTKSCAVAEEDGHDWYDWYDW